MNFIKKLLGSAQQAHAPTAGRVAPLVQDSVARPEAVIHRIRATEAAQIPAELRYPPVDPGLPNVAPEALVASNCDLVDELRIAVPHERDDDTNFEEFYLAPMLELAGWVGLLPASASQSFSGPGGLLRQCMELAVATRKAAVRCTFSYELSSQQRHALNDLWLYAGFVGALLFPARAALQSMTVTNAAGEVWAPQGGPLSAWLASTGVGARAYVAWNGPRVGGVLEVSALVQRCIPAAAHQWLTRGNSQELLGELSLLASGSQTGTGPLTKTVAELIVKINKRDFDRRGGRYGYASQGVHLEPYVFDAVRSLLPKWKLGKADAVIWFGTDGLFLAYPECIGDIRCHLAETGLPGIPKHVDSLVDAMGRSGALVRRDGETWVTEVDLAPLESATQLRRLAIRLSDPDLLLDPLNAPKPQPRPWGAGQVANARQSLRVAAGVQADPSPKPAPAPPGNAPAPISLIDAGLAAQVLPEPPAADPKPDQKPEQQDTERDREREHAHARADGTKEKEANALASVPEAEPTTGDISYGELLPDAYCRALALKPLYRELIGKWVHLLKTGRSDCVVRLENDAVAVAWDLLTGDGDDPSAVTTMLRSKAMLGQPPGTKGASHTYQVDFVDGRKKALVLAPDAARHLFARTGMFPSPSAGGGS